MQNKKASVLFPLLPGPKLPWRILTFAYLALAVCLLFTFLAAQQTLLLHSRIMDYLQAKSFGWQWSCIIVSLPN